ncbi:ribonuclease Y [candidate division WWE3 bacterium RBG_13_37_7]|uniref:Ribonuclease Y n=1 Tax=candidate division WWE3 bacterium RBG_13_37_7 TaxID=1802609 RepID=A0A1F4U3L8_UNCKA|nr:MAG: ribonuclease Y [candidate division WWE3 bacterium RBG_13_37_7]
MVNPLILEARAKAKEIVIEAKDRALKVREEAEEEVRRTRERTIELEKNLAVRKAQIESQEHEIESKTKTLRMAKDAIERKQREVDEMFDRQKLQLEKVASLSKDDARQLLLDSLNKELTIEKGKRIRQVEDEIKRDAEKLSQDILIEAMEYSATDVTVEHSTSKVKLPDEDIKGRIIGKEGRNIRSFEELTGVDLDLDSSPGDIVISSFDSVRREIAKISLERLIADGRIQPTKIEEIVEKTTKEIDHQIYKAGDDLCHKLGVYSLPKELVQLIGRFKYRFSYGQSMIEHTLETTRLGIAIASRLNANVDIVKMGCLLHDIGKVSSDEYGSHVDLGVETLRKFQIDDKVISCVAEHHNDSHSSIEAAIVALADHISGARPGSRSEDYEAYVKRLKELETAATSFDGVDRAFAVSAGREVRVFVSPEKVDDASTAFLAREIARKIELEQTYPGTVKVIVIRETRVSDVAK